MFVEAPFRRDNDLPIPQATRDREAETIRGKLHAGRAPLSPFAPLDCTCSIEGAGGAKQRVLEESLVRIGKVEPDLILPAVHGPAWGYRRRARLSVRRVEKKGGVLVGFHERRSSYVADMETCLVLPLHIAALIKPLRELVGSLSISDRLPQVEVAVGDAADALVLRILQPLTPKDEDAIRAFAIRHGIQIFLQPGGPDTARRFHPADGPELYYALPEFDVRLPFKPTEFTQVNLQMNRVLVRQAVRLLDPRPGERIADLFCGLGNFTLPIARGGASVVGFEGSQARCPGPERTRAQRIGVIRAS